MIKVGDFVAPVLKPQAPLILEVIEILPSETKIRVVEGCNEGNFDCEYGIHEIRPYSAKELFTDVCRYYAIKEPSIENFYSKSMTNWLCNKTKDIEEILETMMDTENLSKDELCERAQNNELLVWLKTIAVMRAKEMKEVLSGIYSTIE